MAQDKKVFQIEINGLKESFDAVQSLNKELDSLSDKVKALSKAKINIKVEGNTNVEDTSKTKVSGNDQSALAKLEQQIAKERQKAEALVTEEYQKQLQTLQQIKDENKQINTEQKQIAQGVKDQEGNYTNTLAGQRALLSELKAQLKYIELGTKEYDDMSKRVSEINEQLKQLEGNYGDFQRNVGNYPSGTKALLEYFKELDGQIDACTEESRLLQEEIEKNAKLGNDISQLQAKYDQLQERIKNAKDEQKNLNAELGKKIQINVGENVRYFDSLKQAAKELTAELQKMYAEGRTGTQEFNDTITALGNVRTAIANVSSEAASFVGNAKGLKDTIAIMQGLTSIGSLGAGLGQLFGGQNEELDKTLKTFTSISLIINGLSTLQQQMNDKTNIFGQLLNKAWTQANGLATALGKITGFSFLTNQFDQLAQKMSAVQATFDFTKAQQQLKALTLELENNKGFQAMKGYANELITKMIELSKIAQQVKIDPNAALGNLNKMIAEVEANMQRLVADIKKVGIDPANVQVIKDMENTLNKLKNIKMNLDTTQPQAALEELEAMQLQLQKQTTTHLGNFGVDDKDIKRLNEMTKSVGALQGTTEVTSKSMGKFGTALSGMGKFGQVASKGLLMASNGFKALGASIKAMLSSTIILAAVMAVMEAFNAVLDKFKDWTGQNEAELVKGFDGLGASIENTRDKLEQFNKEQDRLRQKGELSQLEADKNKFENLKTTIEDARWELVNYINTLKNVGKINFAYDWDDALGYSGAVKDMDEFRDRYNMLVKAVMKGVDEVKASGNGNWWSEVWHSASDAATSLAVMQKAVLGQMEYDLREWGRTAFDDPEKSYQEFMKIINDETYASAISNIDKLFPEDEWQQALKRMVDQYRGFAEELRTLSDQIAQDQKELAKKIEDNLNAAIEDPYKRGQAQRKTAREREIEEAAGNAELIASINAKYDQQEKDAQKSHNKQMQSQAKSNAQKRLQIEREAEQARINLMNEGLQKRLAQLRLEQKMAVATAKANGASKETLANIEEKYNRDILKAEKDFLKEMAEINRQYTRTMNDLYMDMLNQLRNTSRQIKDINYEILNQLNDFNFDDFQFSFGFDLSKIGDATEYKDAMVNYFNEMLEAEQDYIEDRQKLQLSQEDDRYNRELEDEEESYKERLQRYEDFLYDQQKLLETQREQGYLTEEEYNERLTELTETVNQDIENETQSHNQYLEALADKHQAEMERIEREGLDEIRRTTSDNLFNILDTYQEFYDNIEKVSMQKSKDNRSKLGIINYSEEKKNFQNVLKEFEVLMSDIDQAYIELQQKLANNEISFNDFQQAKKELDGLKQSIKDATKDVKKNLENLFNSTLKSIFDITDQYVQVFQNLWSTFSDMMSYGLDAEEKRIEKEQELLDKELEMLEEHYKKQEEITKKHSDKVNDIESELKNARGARREFLIQNLEKERNAQIKSLETENQIAKEKEANEKKQEQLKKQQDELDKKRKKQQKAAAIVQATINTYTAVSNALAVQPWFVGLALSAVALGLGLANVAMISRQQYADGGLLNGKSHAQGGIPVGNTGIEVEGNEYIINKKSTQANLPLLNYINSKRKKLTREDLINFYDNGEQKLINKNVSNKFAEGGRLPKMDDINVRELINYQQEQDDRPIVVSVQEINDVSDRVRRVQALAGINR